MSVRILVYDDYAKMSAAAARHVASRVNARPGVVLGLATGSTPVGMYAELIELHRREGLDFSRVTTFNLDEYCGLDADDPRSYDRFMWEHLFAHVNLERTRTHVPYGAARDPEAECIRYEEMIRAAGGIDLQVLGIGMNGHIGFNEPGSASNSRTLVVRLAEQTVQVNRAKAEAEELPAFALSMGMGTIMDAREIMLLANGDAKADIIRQAIQGPVTPDVPASILQRHPDVTVFLDKPAAKLLELD
jgi:glucosamine-6-phosphate deaminase